MRGGGWVISGGGGYKSLGGMDPDTFAPSDVIHLFAMEIDLDLSVGDPGGAAAPHDDEVGKFSDEEVVDLTEGDEEVTDSPLLVIHPLALLVLCLCAEKGWL